MTLSRRGLLAAAAVAALVGSTVSTAASASGSGAFIYSLHRIESVASTVPANGDVNPYGVAVITASSGRLRRGHVLVSNFNDRANLQGTGTTIVDIAPGGGRRLFAHVTNASLAGRCPGGVGLTTALSVLRAGWVVVGSLPTRDGTAATASAGCLIVLNSMGRVAETISGRPINGPWDMTALDRGTSASLFVTNVLNGTVAANGRVVNRGSVVRIDLGLAPATAPRVTAETVIGNGFAERTDPAALVVGPTGLALADNGDLYVADSLENRISVIPNAPKRMAAAGTGRDLTAAGALNTPLGLILAPNGDVLSVNAGDGRIVETQPSGSQVAARFLDTSGRPRGAGALFGLALTPTGSGVYFVDDATNQLALLH